MNENFDDMITAIGATAELAKLQYDALVKQGFTKSEALELVKAVVTALMGGKGE